MGKTGIEGSQGKRHCLELSLEDVDETVVADLYLLGSVGTGCEISKLWKGVLTCRRCDCCVGSVNAFCIFLVKLGSFGKGWRAEVRVREWRRSRYGEETSVGIRCDIRKLWKGVMKI